MRNSFLRSWVALAAVSALATGAAFAEDTEDADAVDAKSKKPADLPLELENRLEFTTDEATWISLDLTPDGEQVIFEILGDLYRVAITGGEAERLTEGPGFDSQPRVSPDGEHIAFISDRDGADNLWIARLDGSEPRQLSKEKQAGMISPAWTPDGRFVIVTRRARGTRFDLYHRDGGSGIPVGGGKEEGGPPNGGGPIQVGAAFSPDGRYLYFAQSTGGRDPFPSWQIARRDLESGEVDVLTRAEGGAVRPALSPDGRLLTYATRHETRTGLRLRDLETGADRWLIWPVQRDAQEVGRPPSRDLFPGYAFTPDGREVVVTFDGKIHRIDVATSEVTPVPFEARVELAVGPDLTTTFRVEQGPVRASLVQDPSLSADGARLAYSVLTKIWVQDPLDAPPRRLTRGEAWEFKPVFSPDGTSIAYVTWEVDGGHIWRVSADGSGEPRRLTEHPAFYTDLAFSPDGEHLAGLRGNAYERRQTFSEFGGLRIPLDVVVLPADGGPVELVAPARGLGAPHFTDDPERLFVYSEEGLISLRLDGTDRRRHLQVTGPQLPFAKEPPPAETVLLSPNGQWALASVGRQLWVVAVPPPTGGEPPTVAVRGPSVPAVRLTDIGADYAGWADGGETVHWAVGSTFYRRALSSLDFRSLEDEKDGEEKDGEKKDGAEEGAGKAPLDLDPAVEALEIVLEFPRSRPEGTLVLTGATVLPMDGECPAEAPACDAIEDAVVVVSDHRITAVGPRSEVEIPDGADHLDVAGTWIVPGFVDTHAHWEFRTHDVLEPHNWSLVANLAYGVTAGLDVQTSTHDYFAYRDLVETGQSIGQRAFMTGPGLFMSNDFQSYGATLSYLKRYLEHYRTRNIKSYMVGNRRQRQWVVMGSRELGLLPTTEGAADLKLDLTHAIDGFHGNEHALPIVPLYKDVVELYARTRTAYTPTLLVAYGGPIAREHFFVTEEVHDDPKLARFYPHNRLDEMARRRSTWVRFDEHHFDEVAAQAAKIQRAGGLVGVGGHGEVQGLGYHWEMWALAMGGMTPREVLRAATLDGAQIIGVAEDLGSVTEGKLADLVVLTEDPLADLRHSTSIRWVIKNGELYDGETLQRVWPQERDLPPFWWWDAAPRPRQGAMP